MPATPTDTQSRGYIVPIGGAEGKGRKPEILSRFVELCGGENARILVIPTASLMNETGPQYKKLFESLGANSMCVPVEKRNDCFNEETLRILGEATGVFITGGNQLRLSTILGGTRVAQKIRRRNAEGVHVAGTSAGAAIMPEHMIAGGTTGAIPLGDGVNLAPGLGLTNSLLIDQHFVQRDRLGRLLTAISYNPFMLGVGIDEDTAIFISPEEIFEVVGSGAVTVIDPIDLSYSSMSRAGKNDSLSLLDLKLHILARGCHFDIPNRKPSPPEKKPK